MKTTKLLSLILAFMLIGSALKAQTIQVTINNYNASHNYYLVIKVYDYTASPTNICTSSQPLNASVTQNISICQVSKDVISKIYQVKIWVEDVTTSVIRTDQTALLNSDDYYAGNIPQSVTF